MSITGAGRLAGVLGWPIGHSLSPRLHGYWLERYKIDGAYVPLAVRPEDFTQALAALPKLGFAGVNVTVPHKEAALDLADSADAQAQRVGAANTLVFSEDGRIEAFNTDGHGFIENLRGNADLSALAGGPAVVLGAGGAARSVVAALLDAGAPQVRVVNRTKSRAEALVSDMSDGAANEIIPIDWDGRADALAGAAILVNTTVLGMAGQAPLELDLGQLPKSAVVNDLVYTPLQTELLKTAASCGNRTLDGLGMLLHQARPGFEAWFGIEPEITPALRRFVLAGGLA